ncbi:hypothetical protein [Streptomyces gilvus]|uniref:hypothetical protein n=1 Tax=Streptomyces gilvus TaxID=2920937 RepID=UPI001F0E7225|nr:hypothetical protein [Streptomyces sp. CME 23]MCH5671303.1 hypothetical protein [Streptomyces sp. CME 23]
MGAAVGRFGKASFDLLVRERSSGARHFQPVEVIREIVPVEDSRNVRLVLRATAAVDPARAAADRPLHAGPWDTYARVGLGGWTMGRPAGRRAERRAVARRPVRGSRGRRPALPAAAARAARGRAHGQDRPHPRASPLRRPVRGARRALAAILGRGAQRTPERVSG